MTAVLLGLEPNSNRQIFLADSFQGLPKDTDVKSWQSISDSKSVLGVKALGGDIKSASRGHEGQFNSSREVFEANMKKMDLT